MKRIFKYPVPVNDEFTLSLPLHSQILTVQMQKSEPQLWVCVDPDQMLIERTFRIYGTGMTIKEDGLFNNYIGSFQMLKGDLIFHLFEVTELPF